MDYGTIKSEVRSHNEGVAQEFYYFEVITRWWVEDNATNWQHTIIRIGRDSAVSVYNADAPEWKHYHLEDFLFRTASSDPNYSQIRNQIADQHHKIVRLLMG